MVKTNTTSMALARNVQIWVDRHSNNNQVYGDDANDIRLFSQKLDEKVKNGEITNEDFNKAMGYCREPMAEHWQTSNNNNAKSVLMTFSSDMDFDSKASVLKQLLGEDNVEGVYHNRDFFRPIIVQLKDGTVVTYNEAREELSYKNEKVEKYYYMLDTGEFIEEIKEK